MDYKCYTVKSFKHDGHLHRMWMENWRIPNEILHETHVNEQMIVMINDHTRIQEASGKEWVSRIPGISFFIPDQWFNVVALIEEPGIRYYCNVTSPFYLYNSVLTYIDYDLDVIRLPNGDIQLVDEDEYERHRNVYRYSDIVQSKVQEGLEQLLKRARRHQTPFQDDIVLQYYDAWKNHEGDDSN